MKLFLSFLLFVSFKIMAQTTLEIQVSGMVCAFCAQGIESKFKELKEVKKIDVSLEKKLVSITLKEKASLADAKVKELITNSGYNIVSIKRNKK